MKHCQYCASTVTKLDKFGYCVAYDCLERSGKREKLNDLVKRASDLIFVSKSHVSLNIRSCVTNTYSPRTRKANQIVTDAIREFGYVPNEVLEKIPMENREKWDKNIRW